MLGLDTQYYFRDFLKTIAERELDIERQRQILGEIVDFEPYAAFCRLNRHEDKRITADEIQRFLQENGVTHMSEYDCGTIIAYFDSDNDNGLNYKEWMEVLLPCDDLYMRSVVTQRPSHDCPRFQKLSFTIEKQIALLLKLEIEYHQSLEAAKHSLKRRLDWSNMRAFQTIDNRGEGFLEYNNIMNFCRMNSYRASESEIIAIVRRLDIDADQRITFNEFDGLMECAQPLQAAIHGNPSDTNREDPFFRHTSPTKAQQTRSPARGGMSRESSPQRLHQTDTLVYASNLSRQTRDGYESRQRESPLRGSPQKYEAARQASRTQTYPMASPQHAQAIRGSVVNGQQTASMIQPSDSAQNIMMARVSPRRPDSPLRQKSPPRVSSPARMSSYSATASAPRSDPSPEQIARMEHESVCVSCMRPCGCNRTGLSGQPRTRITQSLMMNSAAKQFRMNDQIDETPYDSTVRNNMACSQRDAGLQDYSKGVSGSAPRRHNLKFDEEEQLINAFREYIRLELETNEAKSRLATQPDFNLMDAYQMLDKFSKGWVTAPEIIESLAELGMHPHKDDIFLFVRRYDKDGDGRILYSDFCDAFTPSDRDLSDSMQRRPAYHINHGFCRTHFFTNETREMFLRTIRTHLTVEENAEMLRKRLSRRPDFNVHEAFQMIDRDSNGYITRNELRRVLGENGVYASENDLCMILQRFDRNSDSRISYAEFMEEMVVKCPTK